MTTSKPRFEFCGDRNIAPRVGAFTQKHNTQLSPIAKAEIYIALRSEMIHSFGSVSVSMYSGSCLLMSAVHSSASIEYPAANHTNRNHCILTDSICLFLFTSYPLKSPRRAMRRSRKDNYCQHQTNAQMWGGLKRKRDVERRLNEDADTHFEA